jgi:hypothetical protein
MNLSIVKATMEHNKEEGYLGKVQVEVEGHKSLYEITLHSKKGRDWGYALHYLDASGPDGEIDALDAFLEEDDDAFDRIVEAARESLPE